jgi:glycosyltransferase involved in cell wall biosynthesis
MGADTLSVVLPIHNQADHVGGVVDAYLAALGRVEEGPEVVLVTNACTDRSPELCAQLAADHSGVRHVDLVEGGWGRAVKAGLAAATGELLCYTNAARTTAEMLVLLVLYARSYPGTVIKANRRLRDNWRRRAGSLLYNLECRMLFGLAVWDVNGTPKVFPRRFDRLLALRRDDDLIDAEFVAVCQQQDYPMLEVPVQATVRHGGASTTNYGSAVRMYRGAVTLRRSLRD